MLARAGGYYSAAFTGSQGVIQLDPLSPTIFNVVVDVVVCHWVSVIVEGTKERGGRGQEGRHQIFLFYADDGMVAFSYPKCLQGGWACGLTSGRQSARFAACARWCGCSRRRCMGER